MCEIQTFRNSLHSIHRLQVRLNEAVCEWRYVVGERGNVTYAVDLCCVVSIATLEVKGHQAMGVHSENAKPERAGKTEVN